MFTSFNLASGHRFTRTGTCLRLLAGIVGAALIAQVAVASPAGEDEAAALDCNGIDRELVFAGLDWASASLHNHIAGQILQAGFGCEYTDIPGSTIPMVQGLVRGDVDINMEIWFNTAPDLYHEAADAGDVLDLGLNMTAAEMSFLVPRYVIEGDPERGIEPMAPDLKSVADLARYAEVFKDPEQPDMGRYYNCIIGWQCELTNNKKMDAYGLNDHFTNFRPGAAPALDASIAGAYAKGEAWLGYYWGPTPLLGLLPYDPTRRAGVEPGVLGRRPRLRISAVGGQRCRKQGVLGDGLGGYGRVPRRLRNGPDAGQRVSGPPEQHRRGMG